MHIERGAIALRLAFVVPIVCVALSAPVVLALDASGEEDAPGSTPISRGAWWSPLVVAGAIAASATLLVLALSLGKGFKR